MTRRKPRNIEHLIQCAVIQECRLLERRYPELRLLYAIPNGGARHPAVARKLKAEGVRAGVPDLCLPLQIPRTWAGLYIEMKSPEGKVSTAQKDFMELLQWAGFKAIVCYSAQEAMDVIVRYLELYRDLKTAKQVDDDLVFLRRQAD